MKEGPVSHKYIKVGDRAGPMVKRDIRPDQMTEIGVLAQTAIPDRIIEVIDLEEISEENNRENSRERYRDVRYGMVTTTIERGTDQGREHLQETIEGIGVLAMNRSGSGSRANMNRDRIRCYACREYDHFLGDCPNYREDRDLEQLQHMLSMEEQAHRSLSTHSSDEDCRSPLNL